MGDLENKKTSFVESLDKVFDMDCPSDHKMYMNSYISQIYTLKTYLCDSEKLDFAKSKKFHTAKFYAT